MLDKEDLQAIKELIDTSVTVAITASEERTAQRAAALMDLEFTPKFNLLAEEIRALREEKSIKPRVEKLESDMTAVKSAVRANHEDIEKLKEAM